MRCAMLLVLLVIASASPVHAVAEADAAQVDERILRVSHSPAVPEPGSQWSGRIELADGHNITEVRYQICRVGKFCFAPPTLADHVGQNVWTFDTADYLAAGKPVEWGINFPGSEPGDWQIGVQYVFTVADAQEPQHVPHGVDEVSDECDAMGWEECAATHYFVFTMPGREPGPASNGAPGGGATLVLLAVAALSFARRRA